MSKRDDGGPAFPVLNYEMVGVRPSGFDPGMTLRDYFAAMAMQGLLAFAGGDGGNEEDHARWSFAYADAMLAARAK